MENRNPLAGQSPAGTVCVWLGWLGLVATISCYAGVRSHLGKSDAQTIAWLGGLPTVLLFLVALARGLSGSSDAVQKPDPKKIIWFASAGLVFLGLGVALLGTEAYFQARLDARRVAGAQKAVEAYLRQPREGTIPEEYGVFQSMEGAGYRYPGWNINNAHLIAYRKAHFTKGIISVAIYVWLTSREEGSQAEWTVEKIEKPQSPGDPMRFYCRRKL
jgi:hypothetical protein